MGKMFIPRIILITLFLIIFFSFYYNLPKITFFSSFVLFLLLFVTRKVSIPLIDTKKTEDSELILAPCFGEIDSIRETESNIEIVIYVPFFSSWHFYLPSSGIMQLIKNPKDDLESLKTIVNMETNFKNKLDLVFSYKYKLFRPVFWMKPGDIGKGAACFGYYPFGGFLIFKLPQNSEILVSKHEKITPAKSVIAIISKEGLC
jgi:hypothetical protein